MVNLDMKLLEQVSDTFRCIINEANELFGPPSNNSSIRDDRYKKAWSIFRIPFIL